MRRVLTALLLLVGLVPATLHAAPISTYGVVDAPTQLARSYVGARYYQSQTGRFTTADPVIDHERALLDPQQWNRYSYVRNNPLRLIDPNGRQGIDVMTQGYFDAWVQGRITTEEYNAYLKGQAYGGALGSAIVAAIASGGIAWRAAVGCFLSPSCQSSATETLEGLAGGPPRIAPTGDIDPAARALAQRLGGQASVAIEGFGAREFDVISRQYVGQTFGGTSALLKPDNFLSGSRREQIRATLQAAKATGRKAYFEFRNGVHDDVLDFIRRNADRIGVEFDVYR